MANIVPSNIAQLSLSGVHSHEMETLEILRKGLPNDYTVFHSVHWAFENRDYSVFGEVDFVVLNQAGKVLVIEQKNGNLDEEEGGLAKHYGDASKNVANQMHRSIDYIREKWDRQYGSAHKLDLDYLLYVPDYRIVNVTAPGISYDRIVDASKKANLAKAIQAILPSGVRDQHHEAALRFFHQSFDIYPDVHAFKKAQQKSFTALSGGLIRLVDNLEMHPLRLRIQGVAGCGKSQLALHFYDKSLSANKRPLLVCYNRPLADSFIGIVQPGGVANTWWGFCNDFVRTMGHSLDYSTMQSDPGFWKKVLDMVVDSSVPEKWIFDTVIIDEGQDFEPEWFEMLRLFMREDTDVLRLEDATQNIRQTSSVSENGFVVFHARENYRTPASIAQFIRRTLPHDFEVANRLPGMGVGVTSYESPEQQKKIVDKIIKDLMRRGFVAEDIAVLTCRGSKNSVLSDAPMLGGLPVRRFTGEYDAVGQQIYTDGQLRFDSVGRFKGQQASAIVLVDVDYSEKNENLLYTGMTRATVRLELVVNGANPDNQRLIEAA